MAVPILHQIFFGDDSAFSLYVFHQSVAQRPIVKDSNAITSDCSQCLCKGWILDYVAFLFHFARLLIHEDSNPTENVILLF